MIITGLLAVVASAALIAAAWLRATRQPVREPFRLPTPAASATPTAEIQPAERRQLEDVLDGMRPDGDAARR